MNGSVSGPSRGGAGGDASVAQSAEQSAECRALLHDLNYMAEPAGGKIVYGNGGASQAAAAVRSPSPARNRRSPHPPFPPG